MCGQTLGGNPEHYRSGIQNLDCSRLAGCLGRDGLIQALTCLLRRAAGNVRGQYDIHIGVAGSWQGREGKGREGIERMIVHTSGSIKLFFAELEVEQLKVNWKASRAVDEEAGMSLLIGCCWGGRLSITADVILGGHPRRHSREWSASSSVTHRRRPFRLCR